ncbi:MAG: Ribosomal RNA small subunit methyltransferase G [Hyphomicrobiaceae bacterium hypho_1]
MYQESNNPKSLIAVFNDSRETFEKFKLYESQLRRWQNAINIVAPSTLNHLWYRHFTDSAQIAELIPPTASHLVDAGSGGGFPGLVLAILFRDRSDFRVTLVESNKKKTAFLRETASKLEIPVEIMSTRIESNVTVTKLSDVDIVTARAFAPLDRLLNMVSPIFSNRTKGIFLKGCNIDYEIKLAQKTWEYKYELRKSKTEPNARVVILWDLARKLEV